MVNGIIFIEKTCKVMQAILFIDNKIGERI